MATDDLERMVDQGLFVPGLNTRLFALTWLPRVAELQLDGARRRELKRVQSEHAALRSRLHPDDKELELIDLEQQVTHFIPKLTRGGVLLAIWSIVERSIKDIATRVAAESGRPLPQSFWKGGLFAKAEIAFRSRIDLDMFENPSERTRLEMISALRTTLIHHDGRLADAPPMLSTLGRQQLEEIGIVVEQLDSEIYIFPSHAFVKAAADLAFNYAHRLRDRAFDSLFPPTRSEA